MLSSIQVRQVQANTEQKEGIGKFLSPASCTGIANPINHLSFSCSGIPYPKFAFMCFLYRNTTSENFFGALPVQETLAGKSFPPFPDQEMSKGNFLYQIPDQETFVFYHKSTKN